MSPIPLKTRFAPSPTGRIHLGNVRTALFNALAARHADGRFLLRIEDTDAERSRDEHVDALCADLHWLGLDWQEGVGVEPEGDAGPYRQSQRDAVYARYFRALEDAGRVYPCFCSQEQLALSRKLQRSAGQAPRYAGTCAHLSAAEVQAKLAQGLQPTLRFRVPQGEVIEYTDIVQGDKRFLSDDIGDFIIRRADGTPAFFFTNAIDDALMGVSHVLRGVDHETNTPRQRMLLQALGLRAPIYGHISLVVGADGKPLSKRSGSRSIEALRAEGYLPGAILNLLARLGHKYENDRFLDDAGLVAGFDLQRLGRAPARYDEAQLRHWQKEALSRLDDAAFAAWLSGHLAAVPDAERVRFVQAVRDNIAMPGDADFWATRVYTDALDISADARVEIVQAGSDFYAAALDALNQSDLDFKVFSKAVGSACGVKGKALFMPLRAALTGEVHGPNLGEILPLIGRERAHARLQAARTP
ncbi:MAG: glutamate--tRNA ligase [Gammaproteobacteria bacterium]|nr:glutamate--tRNA ligase [Gammaproteobacteria bacterium]MCP5136082.1 glutamate--tRNA ligase [Gammaproteobacteria bacterium]